MGLFDRVYCKRELPLPQDLKGLPEHDWANEEFQTKCLENWMLNFTIQEDGTLTCDPPEFETQSYHGSFYFYTHINKNDLPNDYRVEFQAIYSFGKLKQIKLIEFDSYCNRKRKSFELKWQQAQQEYEAKTKTLSYKIYKWFYRDPVVFVFDKIFGAINWINGHRFKIRNKIMFWD